MTDDSKFVLRKDYEKDQRQIKDEITSVDRKHEAQYNTLEKKLERQTWVLEGTYDSQKKSEGHLEKISDSIVDMGGRVKDLEYQTKNNTDQLSSLQGQIDQERKGNRDIVIAWIGIIAVALPPLINWASALFKV